MLNKTKIKTVNIHGKDYVPVAERLRLAREAGDLGSIKTKVLYNDDKEVMVKAIVYIADTAYYGHASSDKTSSGIEGQSSVEVAETSAVGRALGFAGFGAINGIASADEVNKAIAENGSKKKTECKCELCGTTNIYHKKGCPNAGGMND